MPKPENIRGQGFHTNPERINKEGRPKKTVNYVNAELESLGYKSLKPSEISDCYTKLLNIPLKLLADFVKDEEQPALIRIVGKAIISGKGFEVIEKMLDRSIGKAVQQIDISAEVTTKDIIAKAFPDPINPEDESQPEPAAPDQQ